MALVNEIQHRLIGFKEYINLSFLAVNAYNFFFGKTHVSAHESKPVFTVSFTTNTNDFSRD